MLMFGSCYLPLAACTSKKMNLVATLEEELKHYHTSGTILSCHLRTLIQEVSSSLIFFIPRKLPLLMKDT